MRCERGRQLLVIYVLYFVHVVISIFLILVVLLQQGKGADLSVFGGGTSQAAFGARGAASLLHKLTVVCFVLFIVTTLSIGLLQTREGTVMSGVDEPAAPAHSAPAPAAAAAPAPASDSAPPSAAPAEPGAAPADAAATDAAAAAATTVSPNVEAAPSAEGNEPPPQPPTRWL